MGVLYDNYSSNNANDETEQSRNYRLVEQNTWNWQWKRAIPFKTELIQIPLFQQNMNLPFHFYLPGTKLYSNFYEQNDDIFLSSGTVTLSFAFDSTKILEYIAKNSLNFAEDLKSNVQRKIWQISESLVSQYTEANTVNELEAILREKLVELPITIFDLRFARVHSPDYETYAFIKEMYNSSQKENIDSPTMENTAKYLFLIKNLATLAKGNPEVIEIIQTLSPEEVLSFVEREQ